MTAKSDLCFGYSEAAERNISRSLGWGFLSVRRWDRDLDWSFYMLPTFSRVLGVRLHILQLSR